MYNKIMYYTYLYYIFGNILSFVSFDDQLLCLSNDVLALIIQKKGLRLGQQNITKHRNIHNIFSTSKATSKSLHPIIYFIKGISLSRHLKKVLY